MVRPAGEMEDDHAAWVDKGLGYKSGMGTGDGGYFTHTTGAPNVCCNLKP